MREADFISRIQMVPYVEGGDYWDGVDCWGLVVLFYKEVRGIELGDRGDIHHGVRGLRKGFLSSSNWTMIERPLPHDLVLFNVGNVKPGHVGLILNGTTVLHTQRETGVVHQKLNKVILPTYGFVRYVN